MWDFGLRPHLAASVDPDGQLDVMAELADATIAARPRCSERTFRCDSPSIRYPARLIATASRRYGIRYRYATPPKGQQHRTSSKNKQILHSLQYSRDRLYQMSNH